MKRASSAINRRKRAHAMHRCSGSAENQREIVGRHLGGLDQRKPGALSKLLDSLDVAHTPFGISLTQAGIEGGVAVGGMLSAAPERTIEKKQTASAQGASWWTLAWMRCPMR